MSLTHFKKTIRVFFPHAPIVTSAFLLIGMMISGLFSAPRAQAQEAGTSEQTVTAQAETASTPEETVVEQTQEAGIQEETVVEQTQDAGTQEQTVVEQSEKPAPRAASGLSIVSVPNSNYSPAKSRRVDTIVLHYISGINVDRGRWDDPALARKILSDYRVSAHYLVARDGIVYKLVDENNVAWHAGGSIMPAPDNRKNVNGFSIGIEIIATENSGFTEAQYSALAQLMTGIRSRHPIRSIVGHDEIAGKRAVGMGLRKDVKPDPGPLFDWGRVIGR